MNHSRTWGALLGLGVMLAWLTARPATAGAPRAFSVGQAGVFIDSGQFFGFANSQAVALGDLDGDGDLDAFIANIGPDRVWLNDGTARFTPTDQLLGDDYSTSVALGDLDDDGDLDAVVGNGYNQPNRIWLNDGTAHFTDPGWPLGTSSTHGVAIGPLTGSAPGDKPDLFVANEGCNEVWWQWGTFGPVNSGQCLGYLYSQAVALGDLDGDGDLDAFIANRGHEKVWLNDGTGLFADSGQWLGNSVDQSMAVALGDLDGDGDLDAFVTNGLGVPYADRIYLNNGAGAFTDSGLALGAEDGRGVALADVDGDGDLDAFVVNNGPNRVWLNDGSGVFTDSGQRLGRWDSRGVAMGDLDGDGDPDAFVVNGEQPNKVWLNSGGSAGNKPLFVRNFMPILGRPYHLVGW